MAKLKKILAYIIIATIVITVSAVVGFSFAKKEVKSPLTILGEISGGGGGAISTGGFFLIDIVDQSANASTTVVFLIDTGWALGVGTTSTIGEAGAFLLAVYGSTTIQTPQDTETAFQILNSGTSSVLTVSTIGNGSTTIKGILNVDTINVATCNGCPGSAGGDVFAWTVTTDGVSTSTTLELLSGFIAASSSIIGDFTIDGDLEFIGVQTIKTSSDNLLLTPANDVAITDNHGLVIGHTGQLIFGETTGEFQILGTNVADSTFGIALFNTTNGFTPAMTFLKSGSGVIGSGGTAVVNNEALGAIFAYGDDASDLDTLVAGIEFFVDDSSISTGQIGGEIVLGTAQSGGTYVTALTINSSQLTTLSGGLISQASSTVESTLNVTGVLSASSTVTTASLTIDNITLGQFVIGGGSGVLTTGLALTTNGQVFIGDGSGQPTAANITGATNITVTNGAGTIDIGTLGSVWVTQATNLWIRPTSSLGVIISASSTFAGPLFIEGIITSTSTATSTFAGGIQFDGEANICLSDGTCLGGGGGGGTPGGTDGQIQYNNSAAFGGASAFFYDDTNNTIGIGTTTPLSGLSTASTSIVAVQGATSSPVSNGGHLNIDWDKGNNQSVHLLATDITADFSGGEVGGNYTLNVCQDSGGGNNITNWNGAAKVQWFGRSSTTQTTDANRCDMFVFFYRSTSTATGPVFMGSMFRDI